MARWVPDSKEPIGLNEHLGRRLFDEPLLAGANDQGNYRGLDLRHFQETRDNEYSLDRLGKSSIDGSAKRYLEARAKHAGKKFRNPKDFDGWIVVPARALIEPRVGDAVKVVPSPESGEGLEENVYHSHALRPDAKNDYDFALHLRNLFLFRGKVEARARADTTTTNSSPPPASEDTNLT